MAAATRPQSWYGVSQPYSRQPPGQQAPLPPGAPDFPPASSCRDGSSTAIPSGRHRHPHSLQQPFSAGKPIQGAPSPTGRAYSGSLGGGRDAGHLGSTTTPIPVHSQGTWQPGHHASHSQPVLPIAVHAGGQPNQGSWTSQSSAYPINNQASHDSPPVMPARPVSPRPMLPSPLPRQASLPSASSPIPGMHSPQPRRNTLPSPVLDTSVTGTWQAARQPMTASPTTTAMPYASPIPSVPTYPSASQTIGRRALPRPPIPDSSAGSSPIPSLPIASPSVSPVIPANLSRSSSVTSSASGVSSASGSIRRPLPRPPLPSASGPRVQAGDHSSSSGQAPASYSRAQSEVSTKKSQTLPEQSAVSTGELPTLIEPASHRKQPDEGLSNGLARVGLSSRPPTIAIEEPGAPPKQPMPLPPSIVVPSISFDDDEDDEPSTGAGPSISISIAPPSPSLDKAISHDYFEPSLPDEGLPLPSCSVPMATSTASAAKGNGYALACPGCGKPVLYGRTVSAMGKRWHPDCFQCTHCDLKLEHFEFFTRDGKPYCHVDYHEVSSLICSAQGMEWLILECSSSRSDVRTARRRLWTSRISP